MITSLLISLVVVAFATADDLLQQVHKVVNKRMPAQYPPPPPPQPLSDIKPQYASYLKVAGGRVTDYWGNEIIFRGVNLDNKDKTAGSQYFSHWNTIQSGQTYSYGERYIRKIVEMGFNAVRLGLHWESIETSAGSYSTSYLSKVRDMVKTCSYYNIKVLLDFHQDGWDKPNSCDPYCGIPNWAKASGGSCPDSSVGQSGNTWMCNDLLFSTQYNIKLIKDWQRFWHNTNSVQTRFHDMVKYTLNYLATYRYHLLGVGDLNEPVFDYDTWECLDNYDRDNNGQPNGRYNKQRQGKLPDNIFEVNQPCGSFYANEYSNYVSAFNSAVNSASYGSNYLRVYNSLITERLNLVPDHRFKSFPANKAIQGKSFYTGSSEASKANNFNSVCQSNNVPALATEYGADVYPHNIDAVVDAFDTYKMHAFYYAFKATSGVNSKTDVMTDDYATIQFNQTVINKIERPYPRKICGKLTSFSYNAGTRRVQLSMSGQSPNGNWMSTSCQSEIWMPESLYGAPGYMVSISGGTQTSANNARVFKWKRTSSTVSVTLEV